jgi:hypothetical protein
MSSFVSFLSQLTTANPSTTSPLSDSQHNNPHATPTPVDAAALFRLVQDQFLTLSQTSPSSPNRDFLRSLVEALEADIDAPPVEIPGVSQEYLDTLDRVPKKSLKKDDACPICAEKFLDDKFPLVVQLPCHKSHRFDLECVSPWLQSKGTCPMCRKDLTKKREKVAVRDESEEEDDGDMMYA